MSNTPKESFSKARKFLITGTFKFSTEFISTFDLYKAAEKFAKDERVEMLSIRASGQNNLALDIRFNPGELELDSGYHVFTYEIFKPFFEKELGGDYSTWWELHDTAYVVR